MKKLISIVILFFSLNAFSQIEKETVFLLFEKDNKETCKVGVESSYKNPKGEKTVEKYRKEYGESRITFHICDEKFIFKPEKSSIDTCTIMDLNKLNIQNIDYVQDKYQKGVDFKHHTFEQVNIIERISSNTFITYFGVYWCCEWSVE